MLNRTDLSEFSYLNQSGLRLFKPLAAARFLCANKLSAESGRVHVVTYADDAHGVRGGLYVARQEAIRRDVERCGEAQCLPYTFKDLQERPEYQADEEYFSLHPFANGHAFKPVILLKALETIKDGDYLFYYDASKFLLGRTIKLLRELCDVAGGALTCQYGDPNLMWVKRAVFDACGDAERDCINSPHLATTWFLFKVDVRFRQFTSAWAELNCRREIAEERRYSHASNPSSRTRECSRYVDNRGDQSIFSVLCHLYGYSGFFGAGYGFNRSPKLFAASMWTGSDCFRLVYKTRAALTRIKICIARK